MSEMKFTPGPWKVVHGGDPRDFIVTESTGNTICDPNTAVYMDASEFEPDLRRITLEEALANAALISAAPELYEACQLALNAWERHDAIDWNILENALKKARGEAS